MWTVSLAPERNSECVHPPLLTEPRAVGGRAIVGVSRPRGDDASDGSGLPAGKCQRPWSVPLSAHPRVLPQKAPEGLGRGHVSFPEHLCCSAQCQSGEGREVPGPVTFVQTGPPGFWPDVAKSCPGEGSCPGIACSSCTAGRGAGGLSWRGRGHSRPQLLPGSGTLCVARPGAGRRWQGVLLSFHLLFHLFIQLLANSFYLKFLKTDLREDRNTDLLFHQFY